MGLNLKILNVVQIKCVGYLDLRHRKLTKICVKWVKEQSNLVNIFLDSITLF